MPALVDARPAGVDLLFRPGTTLTLTLTWPTGALAGRSFSSTLNGDALALDIVGDVMTVEATDTQTTAVAAPAEWLLLEEIDGTDEPIIVGTWAPSEAASVASQASVTVVQGSATVEVAALVNVGLTSHVNAPSDEAHGVVVHRWAEDGWTPFQQVTVHVDGATTNTASVNGNRGRLTGVGTNGQFREFRLHQDTNWADSEVCSLWWGGSVFDAGVSTPQLGHVHRANIGVDGKWHAYVVTNNVFASPPNVINQNIWQTNLTTLELGSNGDQLTASSVLDRKVRVFAVERFDFLGWFNEYACTPSHLWGIADGDTVTIDVTADATFDETDIAVEGVDIGVGVVQTAEPTVGQQESVSYKVDKGTITPQAHKRWWPYWIKSQLRGTQLRVKVWRYFEDEPDWGSTAHVITFDAAGAGNPAPNATAPVGTGLCGVVGAHLRNDAFQEYGDITFRKL